MGESRVFFEEHTTHIRWRSNFSLDSSRFAAAMSATVTTTVKRGDSILNVFSTSLSDLQRRHVFTRERWGTYRQMFFQSVGFLILFYCFIPIPIFFFVSLTFIVRSLCHVLMLIVLSPWRMLAAWSSPGTISSLVWTLVSFYLVKRYPWFTGSRRRRALFTCIWISCLVLLLRIKEKSLPSLPQQAEEEEGVSRGNEWNSISRPSSSNDVSSVYAAYTAVRCAANLISRSSSPLTPLDAYRVHSPFPVYLSILKSNGPQCSPADQRSSCAMDSSSSQLLTTRFTLIVVGLLMIAAVLISRRRAKDVELKKPTAVRVEETTQPLNKKIDEDFRWWLEREHNDGYQQLSEACRRAVNHRLSQACVSHSLFLFLLMKVK